MNAASINRELQQAYATLRGLGFGYNDFRGTYHLYVPKAGDFVVEPHEYNDAVRYNAACIDAQRSGRADTLKGALEGLIEALSGSHDAAQRKAAVRFVCGLIDRIG